jgi:hypothetical protein
MGFIGNRGVDFMFGIGRVQREFACVIKPTISFNELNTFMFDNHPYWVTIGNQRFVGSKEQVHERMRSAAMLADRPDITVIYPDEFEFASFIGDVVAKAPNDLFGDLFTYGYDVNLTVTMQLHQYMKKKYGSDGEYDLKFIKYNDLGRLTFGALVKPDKEKPDKKDKQKVNASSDIYSFGGTKKGR